MSLSSRIADAFLAVGADIKAILARVLPPGGTAGQVLAKTSAANYAVEWVTPSGSSGPVDMVEFNDINTPAAPATGLRVFARSQAGRMLPAFIGPAGLDSNLQPALFRNTTYMWLPGTGAIAAINWGTSWTIRVAGTGAAQSHPGRIFSSAIASMNRAVFATGSTATGVCGVQSSLPVAWRGNTAGLGGFFFFARFGVESGYRADLCFMVGLSALNSTLAGDPSAQANTAALVKDAADTNWHFAVRSATATTKIDTGLAVANGQILDLLIFAKPNDTKITVRLVNAVSGVVYLDDVEVTTNLPVNTTFMYAHAHIRSTTGTALAGLALNRIYVENDL